MKVLVVGNGGREHAIIQSLKKNKEIDEIIAIAGNGGIANDATIVDMNVKDVEKIADWAEQNKIDFAVVAPDDPLVLGAVDLIEAKGIPCFGPNKNAAIIEGSKIFSKNLMKFLVLISSNLIVSTAIISFSCNLYDNTDFKPNCLTFLFNLNE